LVLCGGIKLNILVLGREKCFPNLESVENIQAYNYGLVDYLGSKELALTVTKELANLTKAGVTEFREEKKW